MNRAVRLVTQFSWKRVLIALAGVFAVILAMALRYYGHYHPFADLIGGAAHIGPPPASLRITDAVITGRTDGRLRWRIKARGITLSQDRSQITVQDVHDGVLFSQTGRPLFALAAGQVVYQKQFGVSPLDSPTSINSGLLTVGGGIQAHALIPGGPTLSSQTLTWDLVLGQVRSLGGTEARFPPGARAIGGLTMRADMLVWNTAGAVLTAPGTVVATFADGISRAQGNNIIVDTKQGTLSLQHLHGTFLIPPTVN